MNRIDHRRLHGVLGTLSALALGVVTMQGLGIGPGFLSHSAADIDSARFGGTAVFGTPYDAVAGGGGGGGADKTVRQADQMSLPVLADPIPVNRFSQVWLRNVFSASRVPDVRRDRMAEAPMSGYTLTGVIISGSLRIALLTDPTGKGYSVVVGHALPHTEWRLTTLDHHTAHFDVDGQDATLPLRKTAYPIGPPAIPGGLAARGNSGAGRFASSQQNASNDPQDGTAAHADQGSSGTPSLPPLPPGM